MPRTIVLAYSGGLDTSIIVPWLKENYDRQYRPGKGGAGWCPRESDRVGR